MRLVSPAVSSTPPEVRRLVLRSLKRLLPRMRLAGYGSALLHPLIKVCLWSDSFSALKALRGVTPWVYAARGLRLSAAAPPHQGKGLWVGWHDSGGQLAALQAEVKSHVLSSLLPGTCADYILSLHSFPCSQVLDGPHEELRRDALDTMCALAVALGQVRRQGGSYALLACKLL